MAIFFLLLITLPLSYRYTSLGIDVETLGHGRVACTYYRLRWPGDGSVVIGRIAEHRHVDRKPLQSFDLGGVFLRPGRSLSPSSFWNRLGFWSVDYDHTRHGPPPQMAPGAERARMLGVPWWFLTLLAGTMAIVAQVRSKRSRVICSFISRPQVSDETAASLSPGDLMRYPWGTSHDGSDAAIS